jgi:hypothetical protein
MHHYRCQNVYISSTSRKRIVDTFEFLPHNYPMPQLSSTGRLLMASNAMSNALKHPYPDVPFAQVGDDTIKALAHLAGIFKNKFQKPSAPELIQAPLKAAENKNISALVQPVLTSAMHHNYHTMSQIHISVNPACNTPSLPRVVSLMTGVNLCTTSQTDNLPVPSLGPHPCDYTGVPMQVIVPTLRPPFSSTGQSYTGSTAILKSRIAATTRYSALRVSTMSDSQIQKTVASRCSAVRTHATPDGHTPTPHYDAGHTNTPLGSLMYHLLFPRSCLSHYSNNTH